jgi:hypothetical protein
MIDRKGAVYNQFGNNLTCQCIITLSEDITKSEDITLSEDITKSEDDKF